MHKVEHIGIAVKTLAESIPLFEKLLNASCYKTELVDSEKVHTAFFKIGETKIELLESVNEDGVIRKFIERSEFGTSDSIMIFIFHRTTSSCINRGIFI